jgi:hypothetical protein
MGLSSGIDNIAKEMGPTGLMSLSDVLALQPTERPIFKGDAPIQNKNGPISGATLKEAIGGNQR